MADSDDKIIQKAAKIILGSDAYSRFTKTPIKIKDVGRIMQEMEELAKKFPGSTMQTDYKYTDKPTGQYDAPYYNPDTKKFGPPQPQIDVSSYAKVPNYSDVVGAIHHEDIHALLDKFNYRFPKLATSDWYNFLHMGSPIAKASLAFTLGRRAGNERIELPAYVGAYNPQELPGFDEEARQGYLSALYQTMQPNLAQTLQRIVQSYNASQNPPFQQ